MPFTAIVPFFTSPRRPGTVTTQARLRQARAERLKRGARACTKLGDPKILLGHDRLGQHPQPPHRTKAPACPEAVLLTNDAFAEEARCAALELRLDPEQYADPEALLDKQALGRFGCSLVDGDSDGDGDLDRLFTFGTRSFAIWGKTGELVFDSGDEIEQPLAVLDPDHFNANNDGNDSFDNCSDNKGTEPEGVAVGNLRGRPYAFIGLERIGEILMYDVSTPTAPVFVQYLSTRDFSGAPEDGSAGALGPKGLAFTPAWQSPTHKALLAGANEISGTTAILEID